MNQIKVFSISHGCPKNRVDTERLLACFGSQYTPAKDPEEAHVVFINTCGFIGPAVEECIDSILEMSDTLGQAENPAVLAVAGCLVSRYGVALKQEIPEVDLWLATTELDTWPGHIARALEKKQHPGLKKQSKPFASTRRLLSTGPAYAYLKIAEGCNHRCSFCTIPSIRGPLKSTQQKFLIEEARLLLAQGVKELILVAQDLTAYGQDINQEKGLIRLTEDLVSLKGLHWLRPMYLYPAGLTTQFLQWVKDTGLPLLPYFDVPLQHAHPDILKSMGRPFARDPRTVTSRIKKHLPQAALRTSLIVGYPGETEKHFQALHDFVAEGWFTHLGVFTYCNEEGTLSSTLPEQVPQHISEERKAVIMQTQAEISAKQLKKFIGTKEDILVEKPHAEWPGLYTGRVWFQAPDVDGLTYVSGTDIQAGDMIKATIEEAKTHDLVALI